MGRSYRRSHVSMRPARVEHIRSLLVQELNPPTRQSFGSFFQLFALRPVLALLVIAVFGVGTILRVASASLPGDTLYTVKLVRERAQVRLTVDDTARAQLQTRHAKERASEVQKVVAGSESREAKKERLAVAVAGLQQNVQDVSDTLTRLPEKRVLAEEVARETALMVQLLSEAQDVANTSNGEVAATVHGALTLVEETNALVSIAANPPETFAQSVTRKEEPSVEPLVQESPTLQQRVEKRYTRPVSDQPTVLVHPAQSVFSLPFATSVSSPENMLPYAFSVHSPQNLPLAESIQSQE